MKKNYMDEKILWEIYELFYWKEPKFEEERIDIEVHSMMRVLWHFGISLTDVGFSIDSTIDHFPYNDEIQVFIDNLKQNDIASIKEIELTKNLIMKIQLISIALHNKVQILDCDFSDYILNVSKIIHVNEQVMPGKTGEEITGIEYIDCDKDAINSILLLVKDIDKEIDKNLNNKRAL